MSAINSKNSGFTLIEVIIAITIMSLVMAVLYLAFSTGVKVWSKQESRTNFAQQEFIVSRLFLRDLEEARPYTFNWEEGKGFFFAGDLRTVFYVTSNGFASKDRDKGELFFACAYLRGHEDKNGSSLYLYKTPYPDKDLFESFTEFRTQGDRPEFNLADKITENSILLLEDLDPAGFVFANSKRLRLKSEDDNSTEQISFLNNEDEQALVEEIPDAPWRTDKLPDNVQFLFSQPEADGRKGINRALYAKILRAENTGDEIKK